MKRRAIVVLPDARDDLVESAVFISSDSDAAALRFIDAFEATIVEIAERPLAGQIVAIAGRQLLGCRSWPLRRFKNWRIFYRFDDDRVEVVRLLHASRDLTGLD